MLMSIWYGMLYRVFIARECFLPDVRLRAGGVGLACTCMTCECMATRYEANSLQFSVPRERPVNGGARGDDPEQQH